jgi:hypothetical protein
MRPLVAISTAAAAALLLATTIAVPPAEAQDDSRTIDQSVMDLLMLGIGLEREKAPIEYRERAPLVIPPTKSLPTPESGDAVASNPAWPKDPDVRRRKEAEKRERNRNISDEREREQNPLMPDQIAPGPRPTDVARGDDGYRSSPTGFTERLSPSQLGYTGGIWNSMFGGKDANKPVRFTGEPKRSDLTEPPPGYQTPSPDQPYGPARPEGPKAENNYLQRGVVNSGTGSDR